MEQLQPLGQSQMSGTYLAHLTAVHSRADMDKVLSAIEGDLSDVRQKGGAA